MDRLTQMETFVRVLDTGSFSAAARQLGVGQPAVSKTIAQLEERLGVRLLLRSSHGLTATEAGQNFYERAIRSIAEADEAEVAARGAGAALTGRLRFSASITFSRLHVIPRLPAFLAQHPNLAIEAILDDRFIDLIEEGVDVALRMGSLESSALTARKISEGRRIVVASAAYLDRHGEPREPADLERHFATIYMQASIDTWTFERDGAKISGAPKVVMRTTAAEAVREAVFADMGLTMASHWMFQDELRNGRVRAVLTGWSLPPIGLWAVFPTGRRASAKARAFVGFVEACLREGAA